MHAIAKNPHFLMNKKEQAFVEIVWQHYYQQGRHDLPWRQTTDPYTILVSEIMLQQTQVERVIPKYQAFVQKWPTVEKLANASLSDVLILWQGLGYNRRAKFLYECAKQVTYNHAGNFPTNYLALQTLPGIGPYTAGAIVAFAFNTHVVLIETNIRTVYLHHFFANKSKVSDKDILTIIEKTLARDTVAQWYAALMDYGSYLKKAHGNNAKQSKHYTKQKRFEGSNRQIRGAILKALSTKSLTVLALIKVLPGYDTDRVLQQLATLAQEGLLQKVKRSYRLPV